MKNFRVSGSFSLVKRITRKNLLKSIVLVTAINFEAMAQNTSYNVNSLSITGARNSVFGTGLTGVGTGLDNTAMGYNALYYTGNVRANTAVGSFGLYFNSTGGGNSTLGAFSLYNNSDGAGNAALGSQALYNNISGNNNVALGNGSLYSNTVDENVACGYNSLYKNTSGANNVGFGSSTLYSNQTGGNNTAVGKSALYLNTATGNAAVGYQSLYNNTTGASNVAVGSPALFTNQIGSNNTAIGQGALNFNTTDNNVGIGAFALYHNTTGYQNTAVGTQALTANTTYNNNSAFGYHALLSSTNGADNTAIGANALAANITGVNNTANGSYALYVNTGNANTAMGYHACYNISSGSDNTALGSGALAAATGGARNTAVGSSALGSLNVSGSNNTVLGFNATLNAATLNNATAVGANAIALNTNEVQLGDASVTTIRMVNAWNYVGSDARFKTNVNENDIKGLEFIKLLRPVAYNFDTKKYTEFITKNMPDSIKKNYLDKDFSKSTAFRKSGFIAQEVEQAAKQVGYNFDGVKAPENDNDHYIVAYAAFVVPLVKAVQEQQAMIDKEKADNLQQIQDLQKQIEDLKQQLITQGKTGSSTGIDSNDPGSGGFSMAQNEPNPFTGETVVKYTLPQSYNSAYMAVYDLSGKQITTLAISQKGSSSITITSEKLAAGIYIYSIVADGKIMDSKRMVVADK